jgi:tRNA A37 threonylcarbamoyladenosine synthetase subunit TsaC/SUA5/YrdC
MASTVVDCTGAEPIILRDGAIPAADIAAAAKGLDA